MCFFPPGKCTRSKGPEKIKLMSLEHLTLRSGQTTGSPVLWEFCPSLPMGNYFCFFARKKNRWRVKNREAFEKDWFCILWQLKCVGGDAQDKYEIDVMVCTE